MDFETALEKITAKFSDNSWFRAKICFDFDDEGAITVDATQDPAIITPEKQDAQTTCRLSLATLEGILNKQKDPNIAFMMGQLKIDGSMGVAMKLNQFLEE